MRAIDLRIGNWVTENKSVHEIEVDDLHNPQLFEPILITNEWLLSVGFVFEPKGLYSKYPVFTKESIYYIEADNLREFGRRNTKSSYFSGFGKPDNERFWESTCIRSIKYVHELQNLLFAIKGMELTNAPH